MGEGGEGLSSGGLGERVVYSRLACQLQCQCSLALTILIDPTEFH